MKTFISILAVFSSLVMLSFTDQGAIDEVIDALKQGNAVEIGKYMDDAVELTLPDKSNSYSKAQAVLVLKDFFVNNDVKSFDVKHKGNQNGGQYCVGTLQTKSGNYRTTVFLKLKAGKEVVKEIRFQSIE
jgi:F420-dependent methylenetetrahydromethanopterin dehydrogenase